jgi:hypothetical protein
VLIPQLQTMVAITAQNQLYCQYNSLNCSKLSPSGSDSNSDNYMDFALIDTSANKDHDEVATLEQIFSLNF